jgi:hypothetical protein
MKEPICNIHDEQIQSNTEITQPQVEQAIVKAGIELGWRLNKIRDGLMTGTLTTHYNTAVIEIRYDASTYSINHQESTNMEYDGKKIHKDYNNLIKDFSSAIQKNILSY